MAYPLVPPPAGDVGALTWPRQLQRWLDDNPVGPLTRISTYIVLPAFTQASNTWNGYSDIVVAFNFEGPNHLSLKVFVAPIAPNYSLCISYQVQGVVTRYSLWRAVGDNIPGPVIPYVNQYIDPNFRLEIWNTSQGVASQSSSFTFYTGKLGGIDYRWGTDTTLVGSDAPVTNFENINSAATFPVANLMFNFQPTSGMVLSGQQVVTWTDSVTGCVLYATPSASTYFTQLTDPVFNMLVLGVTGGGPDTLIGSGLGNTGTVAVVFALATIGSSGTPIIAASDTGVTLSFAIATGKFHAFGGVGSVNFNSSIIIFLAILNPATFTAYIYNVQTGALVDTVVGSGLSSSGPVELGPCGCFIYEAEFYSTTISLGEQTQLQAYLATKYLASGLAYMSVPITFPTNATSVTN